MHINRIMMKAVSVLFAVALVCSAAFSAHAEELPDFYGVTAAEPAAPAVNIDPTVLLDGETAGAKDFSVKADRVGAQSAVICWESEELHLSYTLCRYNIISGAWDVVLTTAGTKAVISGLNEDTDYRYAVMNSVDGAVLGTVDFTTGIKKAEVSVAHRSAKAVTLRIDNVEENLLVEVLRSTDAKQFEKIGVAENGAFTDETVEEATDYYYKVKCSALRAGEVHKSRVSTVAHVKTLKSFKVPPLWKTDGTTKTYAYYTAVTAKSTPQYKLLRSDACYTDEETGIRMVDGYYCVALGSYYGTAIGTKYRITLQDGGTTKEINVILCDQKSDRHTNKTHQYARRNKDILEFYVEKSKIPKGIRGDYGTLERFSGSVVAVEQYVDDEAE